MSEQTSVILITGGAKGIGRALVDGFVRRGWRVAFGDLDRQAGTALARTLGERAHFIPADVAVEDDVRHLVAEAVRWGGRLDAVINNAGLANPVTGPIENLSLADWQRRLDVNLTGTFLVTREAVPHLRLSHGAVINLASTRALQSEPDTEAYAATKGGVVALTHALSVSLGPEIRVNSISPGWIDTRAWQGSGRDVRETVPPLSEGDHHQHPAGRVGEPEDIVALAAFLVSAEAGFITGQNLVSDGGMTRKMIYEE